MRTISASIITVALLAGSAIGIAAVFAARGPTREGRASSSGGG